MPRHDASAQTFVRLAQPRTAESLVQNPLLATVQVTIRRIGWDHVFGSVHVRQPVATGSERSKAMAKRSGGGGHYRSAISGRFVTSAHGRRSPATTVRESGGKSAGSGTSYRSAISGRYVTGAHAKRSPNTTVRENN